MTHDNVEMLRRFYAAYEGRDRSALETLLTDDAFAHVTGGGLAGIYRGRKQAIGFFAAVWDRAPDGFKLALHDVLANDHHGLAIVRVTARRGDDRYSEWETHVHELTNGSSAGLFIYWNDTAPADAYF